MNPVPYLQPGLRGVWQFNPSGTACPGFLNRSRCCWLATLYQFPHEEPPRRRSSRNGEYGGINLDGKLFTVGLIATGSRDRNRTCVGLVTAPIKMRSGLGCSRCGRYLEVWWQKSSESLASPPLLSCVGCLGECAATGFWSFRFFE